MAKRGKEEENTPSITKLDGRVSKEGDRRYKEKTCILEAETFSIWGCNGWNSGRWELRGWY